MIKRTIFETVIRNDATGDEQIIYGNFSIYKLRKAGYHIVKTEMVTYEMPLETFVQYATKKEEK